MPTDYSHHAPRNLFLQQPQHQNQKPSLAASSQIPQRRANGQMGVYSIPTEELVGGESPKKRARTDSPSEHAETEGDKMVQTPNGIVVSDNSSNANDGDDSPSTTSMPDTPQPPSREQQLNTLRTTFTARLEIGTTVYLVSTRWFSKFSAWARGDQQEEPGPCDPVSVLCDDDGVVREGLVEDADYHMTSEDGCHGVKSECSRNVIPESPHSLRGLAEIRPPRIALTKIVPATSQSAVSFNFSVPSKPKAITIQVSKADTIDHLVPLIRTTLQFPEDGQLRYYKFPIKKTDPISIEMTPSNIGKFIPNREDALDIPEQSSSTNDSRTLGEIGIVEDFLGIAVEQKSEDGSWPMDSLASTTPPTSNTSSFPMTNGGGRTLGSPPGTLVLRRRSYDRTSIDDDDDDTSAKVYGPTLPGAYPRHLGPTFRSQSAERYGERSKTSFNSRFATSQSERVRGTTGLNNLGNTCYMNSALQCLVHCEELTEYFLSQVYKTELNETNPLGMKGQLARSYFYLIAALFNPGFQKPAFPPTEFRKVLGRFAPNFAGYTQQDSQEFLAFLLDGLHEDLNRVRNKPYVEREELIGVTPSEEQLRELGEKSWRGHTLRNDSVIVDLCQGLYKSTVVCPVCEVVSVTFDPFMDLSVPLPIKQMWKHPGVVFVPWEGNMVRVAVELPKSATIKDLKKVVGERMKVKPSTLQSAEIFQKRFYKHHADNNLLADVLADPSKDEAYLFELPGLDDPEATLLPVMHGYLSQSLTYRYGGNTFRFEEFGFPFYVVLNAEEKNDYDKIYEKIRRKYAQFSVAEELVKSVEIPAVEEPTAEPTTPEENQMQDVVVALQDSNPDMVTIRVQPYQRPTYLYTASNEVEMPTTADVNKVENLPDLREFLRPPVSRMESVAPSAMESVHQGPSTPPDSDPSEGFVDAIDGEASEDTTYFSQHEQSVDDSGLTVPELIMSDDDDDMLITDPTERPSTPPIGMQDDSDDELATASQIGDYGRAHAPSPVTGDVLPAYSSLYPSTTTEDDTVHRPLKFGDALVCVWSDQAYQHVFNNPRIETYWNRSETWQDPNPPPPTVPQKKNIDLDDCLDEFAREEQLGENDEWWCPKCKAHRQARKTLELWRVPDIFVVHLKRFSSNRSFRDKLDNLIEFPITDLDLTERVGDKFWIDQERGGEKLVYDLFAVDLHFGGLGGGHYTAYAKNFVDDKWYYFDDSSVRSAHASDTVSSAAYLLFYRRKSEKPLGGDTARLTAEFLAKKAAEESAEESAEADAEDSNTTSPKPDEPARSNSSSPSPRATSLRPLAPMRLNDPSVLESIYAPLKAVNSIAANSTSSPADPTSWGGGWSNRAAQLPSLTFPFGVNPLRTSAESPKLEDSENATPGDSADADVESTNDEDNEVEIVPLGTETGMDDVEVISIEATGDQQADDQQAA